MNNRILFFIFFILFLVKIFAIYFTNFNLFGDEAQYWLWSKDLDFGYYSKPPFLAWFLNIYTLILGDGFISLKILPIAIYCITAFALYNLCMNIGFKKNKATACSLVFLFIPAVSFSSFILSTDIFLLLFWILSLNQLIKIKINPNLANFILLGIFLGLGFLSKYAAVYFVLCLLIYIIIDKRFRVVFLKNYIGFSFGFVCLLFILFPNIIWNIQNGWITIQHTADNANLENFNFSLIRGLGFIAIQILMLGPFLFLGAFFNTKNRSVNENQNFLLIFSLPVFFIVFVEATIVRANANWAAPALISFFIYLFNRIENNYFEKLNIFFNFIFCFVFFAMIGLNYPAKVFDRVSGIGSFTEEVYSGVPDYRKKIFVVSDRLLFANMSYQLRDSEAQLYMPYKEGSIITNHFMIKSPLNKEMSESFVLIGEPNEINYLENEFKLSKIITPEYSFTNRKINIYEAILD